MSHEPCQCYRPSSKIIGFVSGHAFRHAAQTRSSDIAPIRRSILGGSIGCGKSLNRDDSPPQGLKPSLILHDLRGAKAPLYHSAAGFRDFFHSLLDPTSPFHEDDWSYRATAQRSPHCFSDLGCHSRLSSFFVLRGTRGETWPPEGIGA